MVMNEIIPRQQQEERTGQSNQELSNRSEEESKIISISQEPLEEEKKQEWEERENLGLSGRVGEKKVGEEGVSEMALAVLGGFQFEVIKEEDDPSQSNASKVSHKEQSKDKQLQLLKSKNTQMNLIKGKDISDSLVRQNSETVELSPCLRVEESPTIRKESSFKGNSQNKSSRFQELQQQIRERNSSASMKRSEHERESFTKEERKPERKEPKGRPSLFLQIPNKSKQMLQVPQSSSSLKSPSPGRRGSALGKKRKGSVAKQSKSENLFDLHEQLQMPPQQFEDQQLDFHSFLALAETLSRFRGPKATNLASSALPSSIQSDQDSSESQEDFFNLDRSNAQSKTFAVKRSSRKEVTRKRNTLLQAQKVVKEVEKSEIKQKCSEVFSSLFSNLEVKKIKSKCQCHQVSSSLCRKEQLEESIKMAEHRHPTQFLRKLTLEEVEKNLKRKGSEQSRFSQSTSSQFRSHQVKRESRTTLKSGLQVERIQSNSGLSSAHKLNKQLQDNQKNRRQSYVNTQPEHFLRQQKTQLLNQNSFKIEPIKKLEHFNSGVQESKEEDPDEKEFEHAIRRHQNTNIMVTQLDNAATSSQDTQPKDKSPSIQSPSKLSRFNERDSESSSQTGYVPRQISSKKGTSFKQGVTLNLQPFKSTELSHQLRRQQKLKQEREVSPSQPIPLVCSEKLKQAKEEEMKVKFKILSEDVFRKPRKEMTQELVEGKVLGYLLKKLRRPEDFMTVAQLSLENKMKEMINFAVFQTWSVQEAFKTLKVASIEKLNKEINELIGFSLSLEAFEELQFQESSVFRQLKSNANLGFEEEMSSDNSSCNSQRHLDDELLASSEEKDYTQFRKNSRKISLDLVPMETLSPEQIEEIKQSELNEYQFEFEEWQLKSSFQLFLEVLGQARSKVPAPIYSLPSNFVPREAFVFCQTLFSRSFHKYQKHQSFFFKQDHKVRKAQKFAQKGSIFLKFQSQDYIIPALIRKKHIDEIIIMLRQGNESSIKESLHQPHLEFEVENGLKKLLDLTLRNVKDIFLLFKKTLDVELIPFSEMPRLKLFGSNISSLDMHSRTRMQQDGMGDSHNLLGSNFSFENVDSSPKKQSRRIEIGLQRAQSFQSQTMMGRQNTRTPKKVSSSGTSVLGSGGHLAIREASEESSPKSLLRPTEMIKEENSSRSSSQPNSERTESKSSNYFDLKEAGLRGDPLKVGANFQYICTILHDQDSSSSCSEEGQQLYMSTQENRGQQRYRTILPEVFVPYLVQSKEDKDFLVNEHKKMNYTKKKSDDRDSERLNYKKRQSRMTAGGAFNINKRLSSQSFGLMDQEIQGCISPKSNHHGSFKIKDQNGQIGKPSTDFVRQRTFNLIHKQLPVQQSYFQSPQARVLGRKSNHKFSFMAENQPHKREFSNSQKLAQALQNITRLTQEQHHFEELKQKEEDLNSQPLKLETRSNFKMKTNMTFGKEGVQKQKNMQARGTVKTANQYLFGQKTLQAYKRVSTEINKDSEQGKLRQNSLDDITESDISQSQHQLLEFQTGVLDLEQDLFPKKFDSFAPEVALLKKSFIHEAQKEKRPRFQVEEEGGQDNSSDSSQKKKREARMLSQNLSQGLVLKPVAETVHERVPSNVTSLQKSSVEDSSESSSQSSDSSRLTTESQKSALQHMKELHNKSKILEMKLRYSVSRSQERRTSIMSPTLSPTLIQKFKKDAALKGDHIKKKQKDSRDQQYKLQIEILMKQREQVIRQEINYFLSELPYVENQRKYVEKLKASNLNCNEQDANGNSLLSLAVQNGKTEIAEFLLKQVSNTHGNTPLHYAIAYGHQKCADLLLSSGANEKARNIFGDAPWDGLRNSYQLK